MFEIISALIPFLLLGLAAAGLSRVSGGALSMVCLLYTSRIMGIVGGAHSLEMIYKACSCL